MFGRARLTSAVRATMVFLLCLSAGVACGTPGNDETSDRQPTETRTLEPNQLTLAAAAAQRTGSVRMSLTQVMEITSGPAVGRLLMTGESVADFQSQRTRTRMKMSTSDEALEPAIGMFGRVLAVGEGFVFYMKMPALERLLPPGKRWVRFDMQAVGEQMGIDLSELTQMDQNLDYLEGATDIEELGSEDVDGVRTTHYSTVFDFALVAAESDDEDLVSSMRKIIELSGIERMPADVWLDRRGLVRKMVMEFPLPTTMGGEGTMLQAMEFYDYGKPVHIQLPPPDTAVDLQDIQGLTAQ